MRPGSAPAGARPAGAPQGARPQGAPQGSQEQAAKSKDFQSRNFMADEDDEFEFEFLSYDSDDEK